MAMRIYEEAGMRGKRREDGGGLYGDMKIGQNKKKEPGWV